MEKSDLEIDVILAILWAVWRERNRCTFQDVVSDPDRERLKALSSLHAYGHLQKKKNIWVCHILWEEQLGVIGFFDGAQEDGLCGAGMVIRIRNNLFYRLWMEADKETNTKAELLALWGLLYFAKKMNILDITILRDSKVIIEWEKDVYSLRTMELQHWAKRTKDIISTFQRITFRHIYWEQNTEADGLSKLALREDMNNITWALFLEGDKIDQGILSIL